MEMMNRAIEGASDFQGMMQNLRAGADKTRDDVRAMSNSLLVELNEAPRPPSKRPGENREQYRARIRRK